MTEVARSAENAPEFGEKYHYDIFRNESRYVIAA
jgi:hypothetical protein